MANGLIITDLSVWIEHAAKGIGSRDSKLDRQKMEWFGRIG